MSWTRERLLSFGDSEIAVGDDGAVTYGQLADMTTTWRDAITSWDIGAGDRVGLICDYHIEVVALLLALIDAGCVVVPLSEDDRGLLDERLAIACVTKLLTIAADGKISPQTTQLRDLGAPPLHPLQAALIKEGRAGVVIFTSGSTGKGKAVLLDWARMTERFRDRPRKSFRTLLFLKLDHIGGLNTLLSVIFNGGTIVTCASRRSSDICAAIERHRVELLPTTPSFLTMLLMSGAHRQNDLSSLEIITYGTEVMPDSTLRSLHQAFPDVMLKQTYGLSELGILSTQSKDSTSKWMKIGGTGFELQVREGKLWIRSAQAMLGYLNAPSPFDADGWYDTGDRVEVDGDYLQILGRESEIINVAGEKVFPIEVESVLLTVDNVKDAVVRQKKSPVTGQMIWAECLLEREEDPAAFKRRVLAECSRQLAPFKVPALITIAKCDTLVGGRYKKIRKTATGDSAHAAVPSRDCVALPGFAR